jgi:hypothetical protein
MECEIKWEKVTLDLLVIYESDAGYGKRSSSHRWELGESQTLQLALVIDAKPGEFSVSNNVQIVYEVALTVADHGK